MGLYPISSDAWKGNMEAGMERLSTDVTRLLRGQEHRFGPEYDRAPAGQGQGTPKRYRLTAVLYRGITAAAKELQWDGDSWEEGASVTITAGATAKGYWFIGDEIWALENNDSSQIIPAGSGTYNEAGVNSSTPIAKGSSGSRTLDNGKSVTLYARFEALGASKEYMAWWSDANTKWYFGAEC